MTLIDGDRLNDSIHTELCADLKCDNCSMRTEGGGCRVGLLLLVLLEYALMVAAHDADERAERMYRRWKDERDNSKADK